MVSPLFLFVCWSNVIVIPHIFSRIFSHVSVMSEIDMTESEIFVSAVLLLREPQQQLTLDHHTMYLLSQIPDVQYQAIIPFPDAF